MGLAVVFSRALCGMEAPSVIVEVNLAKGLPGFTIVGLPDAEVREAKDRVRAALQNSGFDFPVRRITVNLAPADLPKESGRFDLPMAIGILAASDQIAARKLKDYELAGELSLTGELRPVRGALAMAVALQRAGDKRAFIVPRANADEAALAEDAVILPAATLAEVCAHFARSGAAPLARHVPPPPRGDPAYPDFSDVKGQPRVKRALEVAAAGHHSVLMLGPPGAGKTMLATRFAGLLPPMSDEEALESASIHSLNGGFSPERWKLRPFRSPHHTSSAPALIGGGSPPRPGEVSLAHHGVLFLDELPEFERRVLEVLRQPLESGCVSIARAAGHADFPARFQLIAAMNPCPCGYLAQAGAECRCSNERIQRYQQRLSGPLLDRIDIQIEVAALTPEEIARQAEGEPSTVIAARVLRAHTRQLERQGKANQHLGTREIDRLCQPDTHGQAILKRAMTQFEWSARAYHRVLRVARTIADLAGAEGVGSEHVSEAIEYRRGLFTPPNRPTGN
ncbi:MAG TPA: YifB family Mg chelatase-like AAA ATPase [Telluria sp.]|nr:YifB family Mg chelatase-like AAA ATPase [Telluria sp.]